MDSTTPVKSSKELDDLATARLEFLVAENSKLETALRNDDEGMAASLSNPISTKDAVAQLGLLTGVIPTSAIFAKMAASGSGDMPLVVVILLMLSVVATATAGFYSGKAAGLALEELEKRSWPLMAVALPFAGAVWGLLSGAAGGFLLFGIGAVFGGAIGGLVGAGVFTLFGILHRLTKEGDAIERNRFLPIAFGLTSIVAALILGL